MFWGRLRGVGVSLGKQLQKPFWRNELCCTAGWLAGCAGWPAGWLAGFAGCAGWLAVLAGWLNLATLS